MTDEQLRQLVRDAVHRALSTPGGPGPSRPTPPAPPAAHAAPVLLMHPSMARYHIPRAADDVMCVIEPASRCDHCGYCQCHGH